MEQLIVLKEPDIAVVTAEVSGLLYQMYLPEPLAYAKQASVLVNLLFMFLIVLGLSGGSLYIMEKSIIIIKSAFIAFFKNREK